jgi:hypothetical protein
MSDISRPAEGEVISNKLPVPYVTPYTNRTPVFGPLLITVIAGWAYLMVEWGTLRWIDHAPVAIWIASTVIGALVLGVIARKDWLDFKNRRYFKVSLSILMFTWVAVVGLAYYLNSTSPRGVDPAVANLQSQLALQLFLPASSESMGNHDSDIVDADGVG